LEDQGQKDPKFSLEAIVDEVSSVLGRPVKFARIVLVLLKKL
jgi:phosphoglycerate kinase